MRRSRPTWGQGVSTRIFLMLLSVALLAPVLVFSAFLIIRLSSSDRLQRETEAIEAARRLAVALDRDIGGLEIGLQALATSDMLANGDWTGFYRQASEVARLQNAPIVLRRPGGAAILNTRVPMGNALPVPDTSNDAQIVAEGHAFVSNLVTSALTHQTVVAITIPVKTHDGTALLLSTVVDPERFVPVLTGQQFSPNWTLTIVDRANRVVARSHEHAQTVGTVIDDETRRHITDREGVWSPAGFGQGPMISAYERSDVTDFKLIASASLDAVAGPFFNSLRALAIFGAAALVLSLLLASWLSRLITGPLKVLVAAGGDLQRSTAFAVTTPVRELNALAETLDLSSSNLRQQDLELRELNRTLESRVAERTTELAKSNRALLVEMSQREEAESQVRQMQKMEAIGQLTGGVAHDFNNMLAVIMSGLSLIQRRLARGDTDVTRFIDAAMDGASRAATLTQRLLAFSRQQPLTPEPIDVNAFVSGLSELVARTLGEALRIEISLGEGVWKTHADASQLENALLNLAVNARDAMDGQGKLTIATANADIDEDFARDHPGVPPGQYAVIAVSDTGTGMTPDVIERAFDPFFTTKGIGKGTGLGLSQVYGFVRQTGGRVQITSKLAVGTTIKIYLPRFEGAVVTRSQSSTARVTGSAGETILVVEDEPRVRQLNVDGLRDLGYSVLQAENAKEAQRLVEATPDLALLFTDLVMPGLDGSQLAAWARQTRPDLKVLLTTGYARSAAGGLIGLDPAFALIPKPFTMDELAEKIRGLLDAPDERHLRDEGSP